MHFEITFFFQFFIVITAIRLLSRASSLYFLFQFRMKHTRLRAHNDFSFFRTVSSPLKRARKKRHKDLPSIRGVLSRALTGERTGLRFQSGSMREINEKEGPFIQDVRKFYTALIFMTYLGLRKISHRVRKLWSYFLLCPYNTEI